MVVGRPPMRQKLPVMVEDNSQLNKIPLRIGGFLSGPIQLQDMKSYNYNF